MNIKNNLHVITGEKKIYRVASFRELDSNEYGLLYNLELVAGWDYINADENDIQGFVKAENFIDDVQLEQLTAYPMVETLADRLKEEDFTPVDIQFITIHDGGVAV